RAQAGGRAMNGRPFVSFVGAGPGDPELVTLKALRRLREADVVIHDRLIPAALLAEAPADAEIIDAGKAPGRHCMGQAQINWLLVDRARRRGRVVRLKGGDPAIFGRLAEEIDAVRAGGVDFEVVPGGTPDERVVAGRLGDIAARCREACVGAPALLLVGPTVDAASVPLAVRHLTAAQA